MVVPLMGLGYRLPRTSSGFRETMYVVAVVADMQPLTTAILVAMDTAWQSEREIDGGRCNDVLVTVYDTHLGEKMRTTKEFRL